MHQPPKIQPTPEQIHENVVAALKEDIGSGDITARLIPSAETSQGRVITREAGVLCGSAWADADHVRASIDSWCAPPSRA